MEENLKSKLGFSIFIIAVIGLAFGGYFFMKYTLDETNNKNNSNNKNEDISYKIDESKDYIYFENEETISESAEIYYRDVVINLNTQTTLTESLKNENKRYKNNIKYISDQNIISEEIIHYNYDNLYALTFREYETYNYDKYISLLVNDFNYTCFDEKTFNKTKSYIFDTKTGKQLTEEEILNLYDTSMDKIKENIRNVLTEKQTTVDEEELIKIDDTLDNFNTYSLYINDYGKLYISYLVKTTQVDYNEVMEVN